MAFAPEDVNNGVEQQLQDSGGNDAADHGSSDAFHDIRTALVGGRPHDWQEAKENGTDGHDFGPDALDGAFDHSGLEVAHGSHSASGAEFVPGMVKREEHHDAGLRIESGKGHEADPDLRAHVVTKDVKEPESAHK